MSVESHAMRSIAALKGACGAGFWEGECRRGSQRNRTPAEPVPHNRNGTLTQCASFEVAIFCESRSDGRHKPRTSVRGNGEMQARHRVPKGRQADPDKISVVPSGLWGVCCSLTMDLRPWLLHVMPSAFKSVTSERASEGCDAWTLTRHGSQSQNTQSQSHTGGAGATQSQCTQAHWHPNPKRERGMRFTRHS